MKTVQEILRLTDATYEILLFEIYFNWCECTSKKTGITLQKIVANRPIYKWFIENITPIEKEVLKHALPYVNDVDVIDLHEFYHIHIIEINQYYPKTLLKIANTLKLYS